ANEKLAKLAKLDRLTGIYNRGEIEQILQHTIACERSGKRVSDHLSAIMIDLDDFKLVNDKFGHQVGDTVLKDIAKVFEKNIRPTDSVGRWGGEEFLIILPGACLKAAKSIAERIQNAAKKAPPLPDGRTVTLSVGIAEFPSDGNFQSFYRHLDDALYHSKNNGKNQITLYEGE
ncbi:MAG: GGDEF domain-containing protein, partial [Schwartzia sp.]|nr:GGDEF domain-containing protein [Schwartzia sp. (in: firmicutes)]